MKTSEIVRIYLIVLGCILGTIALFWSLMHINYLLSVV